MTTENTNTDGDDLYPNERELLDDETFWRLYREMYRQSGDMAIIRWQAGIDLGPMGSKGVAMETDEWEWTDMSDEELTEFAEVLVGVTQDELQDEFQEAQEHDEPFADPIEERLSEIQEQVEPETEV